MPDAGRIHKAAVAHFVVPEQNKHEGQRKEGGEMQKLAATDDSTSPRIHWKSSENFLLKITLFCFLSGWNLSLHLLTFKAWHVLDISIFSKEDL